MRKLILITVLLMPYLSNAQTRAWETDATPLHRAQKALTDVIIHDIFSPPVASRIYAYTNIAAYEVLVKQNKAYRSMHTQLNSFPEIPVCKYKICASLAAVNAFLITGKNLVFSEAILQDSITQILQWYKNKKISRQEYDASVLYGQQVAGAVMQWAAKDKYKETRSLRRYNYLKQEGKWMPTPPVYMAAVEPNWNRIRPLVLDSASQFRPELPLPFSKDTNSLFYRQVLEVYDTTRHLSAQQIAIASFWDCNPFAVTTEGHLNFATKKISPGGHWMSIPRLILLSQQQGFDSVLELMSILHDLSTSRNMRLLSDSTFGNTETLSYNSRRVEKIMTYLNANFDKNISLGEAAKLAAMTEVAFSRFFKAKIGKTFVDTLIEIRLGHASRLLIETTHTVNEIAYKCGFNNISNFNRIFKKKKDCTPKEFRLAYTSSGTRTFV